MNALPLRKKNMKYQIIYADPAWRFNKGVYQDSGRKDRLIDEQYPTMTKKELQQLPVFSQI